MTDVWTVVWKETRVFLSNRGSVLLGYGIILLAFGVVIPLDSGDEIAAGQIARPLMIFCFLGVVLASSQTARSFAGEREMKTLASLLCTRISDASLFLGKVASVVIFSASMLSLAGLLHLVAVNCVGRSGGWVYYQARPELLPFMFLLPFSIVCLTSVVGVLISLRVQSTRGAYLLNLFSGAPWIAAAFVAVNIDIPGLSRQVALLLALGMFTVLILAVALLAVKRFKRETLVIES